MQSTNLAVTMLSDQVYDFAAMLGLQKAAQNSSPWTLLGAGCTLVFVAVLVDYCNMLWLRSKMVLS